MAVTLKDLVRALSRECGDYEGGIATGGSTTTLVDSRLARAYKSDDYFNGATIVLNEGGGHVLFTSDCEADVLTTDFTSVTLTDSDCKAFRDVGWYNTGAASYKLLTGSDASDQAYATKTLSATQTTAYFQTKFRWSAVPVGVYDFLVAAQAGGTAIVSVRVSAAGVVSVYNNAASAAYTLDTAKTVTAGAHTVELMVTQSATVGVVQLWWNGTLLLSKRGVNTGTTVLGAVHLGVYNTSDASARPIWIDDVRVDTAYIGSRTIESERTVTDHTASSGTLTFATALAPTTNVTRYSLYDWPQTKWTREQKVSAINSAIGRLWPYWYKQVVDPATDSGTPSITVTRNTYHYALPSDCEHVTGVFLQPNSSLARWMRLSRYSVDGPSGAKYIRLNDASGFTTGKGLRLVYCKRPTRLSHNDDVLAVDAAAEETAKDFVVAMTLAKLWAGTGSPGDQEVPMAKYWQAEAYGIRKEYAMPPPPTTVTRPDDGAYETSFTDRIEIPSEA